MCAGIETATEKLTEMKLDRDTDKVPAEPVAVVPVVGGAMVIDDSDSDSEPAVDIDDFQEEEDPVGYSN